MLWGCKTLVAPLSFRAVSPRQEVKRGCAGEKGSPPGCRQPGLCSCKSKRLVPAAAQSVHPQPQVRKVPFFLWCRGALNCLRVDLTECRWCCSCSCAPETSCGSVLLGMRSTRWVLQGAASLMEEGLGEKEEVMGLQPKLGVWEGVKLNKQSSIPAHNFSCVEE